jgi:hypothetical protein
MPLKQLDQYYKNFKPAFRLRIVRTIPPYPALNTGQNRLSQQMVALSVNIDCFIDFQDIGRIRNENFNELYRAIDQLLQNIGMELIFLISPKGRHFEYASQISDRCQS